MIVYDEKGQELNIDDDYEKNGIGQGKNGTVYHEGADQCAKIYYGKVFHKNRLQKDAYDILKSIDFPFLVQMKRLLYNDPHLDELIGYLMKYYSPKKLKILWKNTKYSLYILGEFMKVSEILSKEHIVMRDLARKNTIYTGNEVVIVDPDLFKHLPDSSIEDCQKNNYIEIYKLMRNIYFVEVKNMVDEELTLEGKRNLYQKMNDLFDYDWDSKMVKSLSRKLRKYKYPIDYFLK